MKKVFYLLFPLLIIAAGLLGFISYDAPFDTLLSRLNKFTNNAPQEKVHLHFDKPFYSLGEDIWFKAYVVDARQNLLSSQSKILYVDLVDDQDSVKQSLVLPLLNGTASGNIHLNDSALNAGNYHIYAYTRWMQNFDHQFIFEKSIPIVNAMHGAVIGNIIWNTTQSLRPQVNA